jgi:hypothetical protein
VKHIQTLLGVIVHNYGKSIGRCSHQNRRGTVYDLMDTIRKRCPNDAMIITYVVDGETRYDLTRSQKEVRIFNMYWDKFRENLKGIGFGMGRTNPKLWGIEPPTPTKKRK